ncbi:MAG: 1-acyl-sn-glycerol-3-phosphate acyltransferase [Gammaproteobacteria bacterium]|nr:1-acyl-sn-glycerol-3-phosphate acyltransferase [Gammaproteobacteria bacterium]
MVWLRSVVFQVYFFASVAVAATMTFLCWPLPHAVRFGIARIWGKSMLIAGRFFCGLDYVIEGMDNIPDHPSVIMIKHTTVFETYAQLAIFPPQTWVLKHELLWIPIFGWGLAAMKPIAIDRGAGHRAVTQVIEQGKARLADGIWVTIFPEGTRMPLGETKRYGISGAALASEAQVPVLPVAHNAGDFWPRRGLKKEPGLIRFCIGPPILPGDTPPRLLNLKAQEWVESKMREISIGYRDQGLPKA